MSSSGNAESVNPISQQHFEALCHSRLPFATAISTEVEWWAGPGERVLGTVVFDRTDEDWFWILLGRDERSVFRCIKLNCSIKTRDECREQLKAAIAEASATGQTIFPQMDQEAPRNDILIPVVPEEKLHPNFRLLIEGEHHSAARELINEVAYAFIDIDGNYIKDFQTTGFNARLWELYLFAFLREQQFSFSREFSSPDYLVQKWGFPFGIEAVTVNQTANKPAKSPQTQEEIQLLQNDYAPIKFGSALYSKLQKKYWELPQMQGIPFVLAIHDFHGNDSMMWTAKGLGDYLFGIRTTWEEKEDGTIQYQFNSIKEHTWEGKTIPSGFFNLPGAENISAVLFSKTATLAKFNRIGKLAGLGNPDVTMTRIGKLYNWEENAKHPLDFSWEIEPGKTEETWTEGVEIFHNPRALLPLPDGLFQECAHHIVEDGQRKQFFPEVAIMTSITFINVPTDGETTSGVAT